MKTGQSLLNTQVTLTITIDNPKYRCLTKEKAENLVIKRLTHYRAEFS